MRAPRTAWHCWTSSGSGAASWLDHFAVEARVDDAGPAVSSLWPLMVIQTAIAAVEAEMAQGKP